MKLVLIGATGFVGRHILQELLNRQHPVTAIVRHPEKLTLEHPLLTIVKGDILQEDALVALLKNHDAVVSAYNPGWSNPDLYNAFLAGSKSIQAAVRQSGVKRLLVIGGAGSLFIAPGVQIIDTPAFPEAYKPGAGAARDYLNIIKQETDLEWTFFSPAIEMNHETAGVRKGVYRTGLDNPVFDEYGKSILSVEDLAVAIADELEHPQFIRRRFTAAY